MTRKNISRKCISCGEDADARITSDLDIKGVPVCSGCSSTVKAHLSLALMSDSDDIWDWFYETYNIKDHRNGKNKTK